MNVKKTITPKIVIGDQPTEADLADLQAQGFAGVVNLRHDGEPEQPIGTAEEGELVRGLGMEYLHLGIGGAPLSDPGVSGVCDFIDRLSEEGKVLVHCRKGGRAVALVLLQQARSNGWTAEEAVEKGRTMGLQVDGPLRTVVEDYLRARS
jgi:uncharacterized protein (TIGR01244 family)